MESIVSPDARMLWLPSLPVMWYEHDCCGLFMSVRLPSTTVPEGPISSVPIPIAVADKTAVLRKVRSKRTDPQPFWSAHVQRGDDHEPVRFNNGNRNNRLFTYIGNALDTTTPLPAQSMMTKQSMLETRSVRKVRRYCD